MKEKEIAEARQLWEEARGMPHLFTPDWEKDQEYLSKIYAAARLGHLEAMTQYARARLKELAERGVEEARLFLET